MNELEDKIAASFSRAITRRTILTRAMRWTAAAGAAMSTAWRFTPNASAAGCGVGHVSNWGCWCAGTPGCGSGKCCFDNAQPCCGGAVPRCDRWGVIPSCWCSLTCCIGSSTGYFSCCDCWSFGDGDNNCHTAGGATACICGHRHLTGSC